MTRMFGPTRLLLAAGLALLCLVLALGYASAQSPPAAPTIDSVSSGDTTLTLAWTAPAGATGITAYDVRHIETSADETDDANWTVVDDAWTSGALEYAVTGLTNGTEYDVQVRAVDVDDVDGAWSATTSATPADHGNDLATAKSVTAGTRVWGVIDPAGDEDYFSFSVSRTSDYWIYALGDLDTVGELLDSGGMSIDINDRGGALPNPDNFFLWQRLQSGTYFIKVTGYGPTDEPYILRVREFTDTTSRSNAATLNLNGSASGTIDPEDDDDYFKLELSETTEVAIRASGFPDTVGELQRSNGTVIASNDDGYLPGNRRNFVIRENLAAGVYYVKVSSFDERSDGPYSVYAAAITEPGSAIADAQPLTLGGTAGGIIDPAGDEDYFSLTLEETTYVIIGGVSKVTNISAALTDENDLAAPVNPVHSDDTFFFQGRLGAGTYYLKVTGKDASDTGRYTVRAIAEGSYTYFVDRCSNISRSAGINDPLYGCQWHLNNDDQFRNSAEQDIRVEEVWPTYTGDGINVAVVDDGMHHQHEDLTGNVLTALNHNYDPDLTDIYQPFEDHGTAVAGLIAAKDNSLGMRGVAPEATIYGYNLLVNLTDMNIADAMNRNATSTAISNNSWRIPGFGRPVFASTLWEHAVENGITNGYDGKGVFYVFGAGNGHLIGDSANLSEYGNFYAVTTVCAVGHDDIRSGYSDTGANLWVCGPSSSGRVGQPRIATTDNGHRYSGSFGGTSAATPIVSGAVALIREANNALTWRDVKLILAASVRQNDPDNTGWEQGALKYGSTTDRYNFNHEYGFGMVDAKAAVDLAPTWTNVRDLREITSESRVINLRIPDLPSSGTPTTVSSSLTVDHLVEFVEFVEVNAHFNHPYFRDLTVELVSPSGAVSTLSTSAPIEGALTTKFRFGSARHLGENAAGEWTLQIKDTQDGDSGTLKSWGLTFYGHGFVPGAPQIDTVTPGGGTLEIDWNAPTDTGETAITSYDLRYIRDDATDRSDDNWTLETGVGTPTNRSHTITGLEGGVKYEFQLQASNDSGHGPWSQAEADEPTTVAPAAPAITSITRGDRTLAVVWTAPADTGGGGITAYDVRYIETSADEMVDSNWTVRDNAWRSGDLRYVISNLTNATEYDVQVRAVNPAGDGEWSDTETGTPLPDDIPITLQWEENSFEVAEDAGSVVLRAVFTTTLDAPPEADFTFDVTLTTTDTSATLDDDYTAPPSPATFVASDFSQTDVNGQQRYRATRDFTVAIIDDTVDEPEEAFSVRLAYLTPGLTHLQGGPSTAVVTIKDNEHVPVTLSWDQSFVSVDEHATTVTLQAQATTTSDKMPENGFTVALSAATADNTATQGSDYRPLTSSFSFGQGDFTRTDVGGQFRFQATRDIGVSIINDTDDEPDENFTVILNYSDPSLTHLQRGPATATVTIADNDHVPVVLSWEQAAAMAEEATSPGSTRPVSLNAVAITTKDKMPESGFSFDVTVATADGSATQPADYQRLSDTATFNRSDFSLETVSGQRRYRAVKTFTVFVTHDTVQEPNETFTVTLAYADPGLPHLLGGRDTATVTITDDISATVDLSTMVSGSPSRVSRGEELTYDYTVRNSGPAASTNTVVRSTLDRAVSFVSATPADKCAHSGGATGGVVACTFDALDAGANEAGEILVRVGPAASADIAITSMATGNELDRRPGDNTATQATELVAPPELVRNLSPVRSSAAFIELSWARPSDNGSPITRYELERKEAGESYALVSPGPGVAATTYRDSQVSAGTTYTYQLRAVNADGDGQWSDEATATARETPPPPPPPPPPPRPSDRPPVFADGPRTDRSIAENTAAGENVGAPVVATDSGILTYMLGGADAGSFGIVAATGQIQVGDGTNLDYEGEKNTYGVEVTATDPSGATAMITVTIAVTNLDEAGTVTLSSEKPTVGDDLTATLGDPDGDLTDVTWQWAKSMTPDMMDSWMDIGTGGMYTVMDDDAGYYLRATAMYTDGEDMGKMASEETMMVGAMARDQLLAEYDPNGDGVIEKADMRKAVAKFFAEPAELSRSDMRRLVGIYFR